MYGSAWTDVQSFLSKFGVTGASVTATAQAFAAPTLANIKKVEAAFASEGTAPPPEMMDLLYQRYYDSLYSNPFYSISSGLKAALPWVLGGGLLLFAISYTRKGAR
ncbi:MAG: hypothetical protein WC329_04390 [Candidatus Omnitrophota bacterium]|jgi:hypothetical protein